jgi:hypothetical protein
MITTVKDPQVIEEDGSEVDVKKALDSSRIGRHDIQHDGTQCNDIWPTE